MVVAIAALVMALLWTYELVSTLNPGYPTRRHSLVRYERHALLIFGVLGIGAFVTVSASGVMYVRTAAKGWITGMVGGSVYAIASLVAWLDLWEVFTGSD
jgi:hypothetical protein